MNAADRYPDLPALRISCGMCLGCRLRRTRDFAIRSVHEATLHEKNSFLTLTYDDKHCPKDGSLYVSHFQRFMRDLRRARPGHRLRYLHCGEYGEKKLRPHSHVLLFGEDFADSRVPVQARGPEPLYMSAELHDIWKRGFVWIGSVEFDSAAYVAAYATKKVHVPSSGNLEVRKKQEAKWRERYERVSPTTGEVYEVKPEYATMSLKPGLGRDYLTKYRDDIYPRDYVTMKGRKMRPPVYYDRIVEKDDPQLFERLVRKRRARAQATQEQFTEDRLLAKELVEAAKRNACRVEPKN